MRRLFVAGLLLALCSGTPQAFADDCQDAIDEYNEWNRETKSWVDDALQSEFGTSELGGLDRSDPDVCRRLLPIQQEHLSRAEELVSLRETAYGICDRVRESGTKGTAQQLVDAIQSRIQSCEETIADAGSEESEEEFKAAQQQAEQQQAAQASPPPGSSTSGYGRSANCSDITGTGGGGSAADCPEPKKREFAAAPPANETRAPAAASPPAQTQPGVVDRLTGLAGSIVDALGRVRSGQEDGKQKSSTGASLPEDFDPRTFDSYRNNPPELPEEGMLCRQYFLRMLDAFHQNARLCIRDTRLLRSMTDMVGKEESTAKDIVITRRTAPDLYAYFGEDDPRWRNLGDSVEPRCEMPLTVTSQAESFKECARAYLCGARAAQCGLNRSRGTKTRDCRPISEACLTENPIPTRMAADPSPPPYQNPGWAQPQPKGPPQSKSTITGPSGPGGGGGSGGVIPAR